jgi:hypothetical protein
MRRLRALTIASFLAPVLATGLTVGCRASTGASPALPCLGHLCTLTVQNNSGTSVTLRYVDSTGQRQVLGLVDPVAVRSFPMQWVRSAGVRLYAVTRDHETFQADVALQPVRATEVHYPEDFSPSSDTLGFSRKR